MESYADFIGRSRGEFTVAKDIYVRARSGWFSDRSVCYLASGRPVLMQETGFSKFIPAGKGLYAYSDTDGILAALDSIEADYGAAQRAARSVAESHFDGMSLVKEIVEAAGL